MWARSDRRPRYHRVILADPAGTQVRYGFVVLVEGLTVYLSGPSEDDGVKPDPHDVQEDQLRLRLNIANPLSAQSPIVAGSPVAPDVLGGCCSW